MPILYRGRKARGVLREDAGSTPLQPPEHAYRVPIVEVQEFSGK